ncbi:MAG: aldose 1-epimerase family protein [Blastocatellia bacterium]
MPRTSLPTLILSVFLFTCSIMAQNTDPIRQTLTSAARNIHLDNWRITHRDLNLNTTAPWSVGKYTLHGGKQEGVDVIVVDNGRLGFTVIPTRGMNVLKVESGDVSLGWNSPVKEVVHPQYINLASRGGLGWLEGFNEWLVRCGLEWAGHPGKDEFINNVGDKAEMDLTLHGKIGNIPASEVEIVIDQKPPHRIRVRGRVDERMFYGPKLELWTEISTEPGAATYRITDQITNHGAYEQEYQVIYHANFGPPMLGKGAKFLGAIRQVAPFNEHAAKGPGAWADYAEPVKGFIEQVYCLWPYADASGVSAIMLRNAAGDRAVSMSFNVAELPYVTLWKNTNAIEEGYVTGLEPGTGFPYNRRFERKAGRVPKIAPHGRALFTLDFALHTSAAEVNTAATRIDRIQAGRKTGIQATIAKVE